MENNQEIRTKYTFSGHESFQCRQQWLKKGFDYVSSGRSFRSEDSVVTLGVGKNMVSSIRYWMKSFNLINSDDQLTSFATSIFDDNIGYDPYLEDEATLWLLHYQLVANKYANTYSLIFNELRREKVEFLGQHFVAFIKRKSESESGISFNINTINADFEVFKKMYYADSTRRQTEDSYSGLLSELNLLKAQYGEKPEDNSKNGRRESFYIENTERGNLPVEIFIFSVLNNPNFGLSISLNSIEHDYDSPGSIFAINRFGILNKIQEAIEVFDFITFNDHAGIKELQFKHKPDPYDLIKFYYEK